jgi:bidirectional [NiFe] hydrogenase diaphorase subunit
LQAAGGIRAYSLRLLTAAGEHNMPLYAERPPLPSDDKRWRIVNGTMRKHGFSRNALIETLHTVQSSFGFLDESAIKFVAQSLRVPLSQAYGVVTFYHFFSLKPPGKHTCTVCTGTACYIKGSDKLVAETEKLLHIKPGQTTPDGEVSFTTARCVGACGRAPVTLLDGELSGQMEVAELKAQLERWTMQ